MHIAPTIGRVVLYWPPANNNTLNTLDPSQPMRADVVFVHDDKIVNLLVTDHIGNTYARAKVPLVHEEGDPRPDGGWCEWMKFQKGQAPASDAVQRRLAVIEDKLGIPNEVSLNHHHR